MALNQMLMGMKVEEIAEMIDVNARRMWREKQGSILNSLKEVQVGDLVLEVTKYFSNPAINRLGYLKELKQGDDGLINYSIERLDGVIANWSDCTIIKVPAEFEHLTRVYK